MKSDRIAIYIRLSMEDFDLGAPAGKEESASISSQRDFIMSYINRKGEFRDAHVREFVDDGYSGMNFARPGVQEMLALCRQGEIDCIIVKDLSRFGRNYLEVGNYLEQVFPFLGVRFIGINDGFDSRKLSGGTIGMDVVFRNFIYEMYSRDLSEKIKSGVSVCMKRGEYYAGCIVYGYQKAQEGRGIAVDQEAARVVRRIFREMAEGKSPGDLARELNLEGIPDRLSYKQKKGEQLNRHYGESCWNPDKIRTIIRNQVYTGDMVYGKNRRARAGARTRGGGMEEDLTVIQDHHKAVVDRELFQKANDNIRKRAAVGRDCVPRHRGKIFCGYCQNRLELHQTKAPYYQCRKRGLTEGRGCDGIRAEKGLLGQILGELLLIHWNLHGTEKASCLMGEQRKRLQKQARALGQRLDGIPAERLGLYERFCQGAVSQSVFLKEKEEFHSREKEIRQKAEEISARLEWLERKWNAFWKEFKSPEESGVKESAVNEFIDWMVEKVILYQDGRLEAVLRCKDQWG